MRISFVNVLQFVLGFFVGIALLIGAGSVTAYYFFTRLSATPPPPDFSEKVEASEAGAAPAEKAAEPAAAAAQPETQPEAQATAAATPEAKETPAPVEEKQAPEEIKEPEKPKTLQEEFGEQAYRGRVTWPQGLSLRSDPSASGSRVGGVYYNDELVVIGTSSDGRWQQVHIPATGARAWVKAGNVARAQ
ncbi:MAG: SH3 domain-containing protein [Cyanobacteria bacterium J06641_5]